MLRVPSIHWPLVVAVGLAVTLGSADGWAASGRRHIARAVTHRAKKAPKVNSRAPVLRSFAGESARVVYATAQRAYLNRGKADGVVQGASISFTRRGRSIASCVIDSVAEHQASCAGKGILVADEFAAPARKADEKQPAVVRASMPSASEMDRQLASLASAPYPQVSFKGGSDPAGSAATQVRLGHTSWISVNTPDGSFHQEWLALAVRGAPIGAGLRLFVDALAVHWTHRPANSRYPIQSPNQLLVYQLEISSREVGKSLVFSAGRIWPVHAPGVGTVDGTQLGWRSEKGDFELGILGGAIPDPVTLSPETLRPVVGAYVAADQTTASSSLRLLREEARFSFSRRPDLGWRGEVESSVTGFWGRSFDLGTDLRLGFGRDNAPALVEVAQLNAGFHPSEQIHIYAAGRYLSVPPPEVLNPGDAVGGDRSLHADGSIVYLPWTWFSLGANIGHAGDVQTGLHRTFGGPELGFPRAFGAHGGILLGYQQEAGHLGGKSAYLQLVASPFNQLHLLERVSWFQNLANGAPSPNYEAGFYSSLDWMFASWIGLRASVLGRFSLDAVNTSDGTAGRPYGLVVSANLTGRF